MQDEPGAESQPSTSKEEQKNGRVSGRTGKRHYQAPSTCRLFGEESCFLSFAFGGARRERRAGGMPGVEGGQEQTA
jgi:hypothetical protein